MIHLPTWFHKIRDFLGSIAQRTYPFVEYDAQGNRVFLDAAYLVRYHTCEISLGAMPNMKCYCIFLWEQCLHLWGAALFWAIAVVIDMLVSTPWNLIFPALVILYFAFQEFYLDRVRYQQRLLQSLIDWSLWGVPLIIYILIAVV